jgi:hypothetical protein
MKRFIKQVRYWYLVNLLSIKNCPKCIPPPFCHYFHHKLIDLCFISFRRLPMSPTFFFFFLTVAIFISAIIDEAPNKAYGTCVLKSSSSLRPWEAVLAIFLATLGSSSSEDSLKTIFFLFPFSVPPLDIVNCDDGLTLSTVAVKDCQQIRGI